MQRWSPRLAAGRGRTAAVNVRSKAAVIRIRRPQKQNRAARLAGDSAGVNGLYRRRPGWRFTLPGLGCGPPGAGTVPTATWPCPAYRGSRIPRPRGPRWRCGWTVSAVAGSAHAGHRAVCPVTCAPATARRAGASPGPSRHVRHRPLTCPWVTSFIESSVVPGVGLSPPSSTFRGDVSTGLLDKFRGEFDVTIRLRPCRGYWCLQRPRPTITYRFAAPRFTVRNFSARVPAAVTSRCAGLLSVRWKWITR